MRVEDLIGKMQTLQKMSEEDREEFRKVCFFYLQIKEF